MDNNVIELTKLRTSLTESISRLSGRIAGYVPNGFKDISKQDLQILNDKLARLSKWHSIVSRCINHQMWEEPFTPPPRTNHPDLKLVS